MLQVKSLAALAAVLLSSNIFALVSAKAETGSVTDAGGSNGVKFDIVPTGSRSAKINKRAAGGIYICTDTDWHGICGYAVQPLNTCIHLDPPWYHSISSFGPDQGTTCTWYSDYDCADEIASNIGAPGYEDMNMEPCDGGCNDAIGSFMCSA